MLSDDQLRQLYADRSKGSVASDHLDELTWERLACGELLAKERRSAIDHVTRCAECAQTYKAICLLENDAKRFDSGVPAGGLAVLSSIDSGRTPRRLLWGGLAAAAVLVLAVMLPTNRPDDASKPMSDAEVLRDGSELSRPRAVAPTGTVSAVPSVFSWQGIPTATGYRVQILTNDGELLWESDVVDETSLELPAGMAASPARYYWRVLAFTEAGGEPLVSELEAFDVESGLP